MEVSSIVSSRPAGDREGVRLTVSIELPSMREAERLAAELECELLEVEHRVPGSRFLGWSTCHATQASIGSVERVPDHHGAGNCAGHSQRELVLASLLRRPAGARREVEHGRGMRR